MDAALARRIEKNRARGARAYVDVHARLFPAHGATAITAGGGEVVWSTPLGAPSPSKAFAVGLDGAVDASELARIETFYEERSAPAKVTTCPWTDASVFEWLGQRGFAVIGFDNVLSRRIAPSDAIATSAPGIVVAPSDVHAWAPVVRRGMDDDVDPARARFTDDALAALPMLHAFLATRAGEVTGAAGLLVDEGVATLFATAVLPVHRRHGVHAALVAARLARAHDLGCDVAVVLTEPGSDSQRNLERLGFRVGYTAAVFG